MKPLDIRLLGVVMLAAGLAQAGDGTWPIVSEIDSASYREVRILALESATRISDEYATKEVRPVLEFRCDAGAGDTVRVRIDWRRFISSFNTDVSFQSDDRDPLVLTFGVDRTNRITASRSAGDAERLLEQLRGQRSLEVTVTPYAEAPVAVRFDIAGLDDGLALLQESCNPVP